MILNPVAALPQLICPSVHSCVWYCPERVTVVATVVFVPLSPADSVSWPSFCFRLRPVCFSTSANSGVVDFGQFVFCVVGFNVLCTVAVCCVRVHAGPPGFPQDDPENSKRTVLRPQRFNHHQIYSTTSREERLERNVGREREKQKGGILGPPTLRASRAHPSEFGAPPLHLFSAHDHGRLRSSPHGGLTVC